MVKGFCLFAMRSFLVLVFAVYPFLLAASYAHAHSKIISCTRLSRSLACVKAKGVGFTCKA